MLRSSVCVCGRGVRERVCYLLDRSRRYRDSLLGLRALGGVRVDVGGDLLREVPHLRAHGAHVRLQVAAAQRGLVGELGVDQSDGVEVR